MWEGYINAIDEFIAEHDDVTAYAVVDRFHVAQNYRDDFDDLRKQELRRLKKELPSKSYDEECKGMLWTLRKNHSSLDPDECQRLRRLFVHSPSLHQAYTFREELTAIFNQKLSIPQAELRLVAWIRKVELSTLHNFDGFITRSSVEKWDKKQKGLDEKLDSREASVILVKYDKKNE